MVFLDTLRLSHIEVWWASCYLGNTEAVDTLPQKRGDHYIDLMRHTRGLSVKQGEQREVWYDSLPNTDKEAVLYELEMLLKGVVSFGNTLNHPGPRKRQPAETRKFGTELLVFNLAFERIADVSLRLLGPGDGPAPESADATESKVFRGKSLLEEPLVQDTPEQSLRALRRTFTDLADIVGVLVRLEPVPHRGFTGLVNIASREIGRNAFFNPLWDLEFRSEYDHLQEVELLDIVYGGGPPGAQKAVTLAFLSLFRLKRYLRTAREFLDDPAGSKLVWIPLAALRGDGRALTSFLCTDAQDWLAGGFDDQVRSLRASRIISSLTSFEQDYYLLHELGSMFRTTGDQLGLELRKAFEQTLRPLNANISEDEFAERAELALTDLDEFLKLAIGTLAQVFEPDITPERLFDSGIEKRVELERLRRDIWIFTQILRAFLAKAAAAPETANRWGGTSSYRFVKDFITYFRNLGYHLLRAFDYERFDEFMSLVEALSSEEVLEQDFIDVFVRECELFRDYLLDKFEVINQRKELRGVEFDRHSAAETLRLYLDRS